MNCRDFAKTVLALAREQALEAAARAQSLAHAEVCAQCAARLTEERALWAGMRLVVAELAKEEAPTRVEATLLTAFRAQAARRETPVISTSPQKRRWGQGRMVTAWAVVILFAVITGVLWLKSSSDEQKQAVQRSPVRTPTPDAPKEVPAPKGIEQADEPKLADASVGARHPKTRRAFRRAVAREDENATQFYSLVEEGELAPLESGRVVRVEVPAATLIPFGLPVTAEALDQPIQADLLLGQDGLARAIRFLPTTKTQ